jgi:glutamine amidotransferase-like uncharacterized protein
MSSTSRESLDLLVYSDRGVSKKSFDQTIKSLSEAFTSCNDVKIRAIRAREIIQGSWQSSAVALIMPGGRDAFYDKKLNKRACDLIREYVNQGGLYIGFCAGAYFACDSIEFEKGTSQEVFGDRNLKFFPGKAIGTVIDQGTYRDNSELGSLALSVKWDKSCISEDSQFNVYYNGGCYFEEKESSFVKILARYEDIEKKPPAAVLCSHGKGSVFLTGVHLEYGVGLLDNEDLNTKEILSCLEKDEKERSFFFNKLMQQFTVKRLEELRSNV